MIAALFYAMYGFAEETTPASEEVSAEVTADADHVAEDAAEAEVPPIAQDTRGGAGLKERTLSDVFEQFVPSETISADNAVPFPIDI
jgi:hypothetical protein